MEIRCPNCTTSYQVEPASLRPAGRTVRCARCRSVWFAANTSALVEIALDHRAEVTAFAATTRVADLAEERPAAAATTTPIVPELEPAAVTPDWQPDVGEVLSPAEAVLAGEEPPPEFTDAPPLAPEPPLAEPALATYGGVGADSPPVAPIEIEGTQVSAEPPSEDIETIARRRSRRAAKRRSAAMPLRPLSAAIVLLVMANAALFAWRADVVRWAPQTASLYAAIGLPVNLRGLDFTDVTTARESHDGVQVLAVEGTIANTTMRVVAVPRLRFSVRNRSGHEIYSWTALPTKSVLAPGDTLPFRSRLASPPPEAQEVLVRFFNRRDLVATIE